MTVSTICGYAQKVMGKRFEGRRSQLAQLLTVLVALVIVIGSMPPASRYGETNGLIPTAQRLAAAAAERRLLAMAAEAAGERAAVDAAVGDAVADEAVASGDAVAGGAVTGGSDDLASAADLGDDAFTETIIAFDAPAAGPQTDAPTVDLAAAAEAGHADDTASEMTALLAAAPVQDGWFATEFQSTDEAFLFPDYVDLLGQLHIALARVQVGAPAPGFTAHIKALFARDGKLYSTYDRATNLPAATEESPAVYRLAVEYALAVREHEWAAALRERLLRGDLADPDDP